MPQFVRKPDTLTAVQAPDTAAAFIDALAAEFPQFRWEVYDLAPGPFDPPGPAFRVVGAYPGIGLPFLGAVRSGSWVAVQQRDNAVWELLTGDPLDWGYEPTT